MTKRGTHDDRDYCEPAKAITGISWEGEEGPLNERNPHRLDGASDYRVGDDAKGDDSDEGPSKDGLYDPPVACREEDSGRDPPSEDERGHDTELYATHEATVSSEPGPCRVCVLAYDDFLIVFLQIVMGNVSLLIGEWDDGVGGAHSRDILLGAYWRTCASKGHLGWEFCVAYCCKWRQVCPQALEVGKGERAGKEPGSGIETMLLNNTRGRRGSYATWKGDIAIR